MTHLVRFGITLLVVAAVGCRSVDPVPGPTAHLRVLIVEPENVTDPLLEEFSAGVKSKFEDGGVGADAAVEFHTAATIAPEQADIVVRPVYDSTKLKIDDRLRAAAVGSTVLWVTTWVGGLVVPDREFTYGEGFEIQLQIASGADPDSPFLTHVVQPRPATLSFVDRNKVGTWWGALSIIWFPFWIPPDELEKQLVLKDRLHEDVAWKLAHYLKNDFESEALSQGAGSMMELEAWLSDGEIKVKGRIRSRRGPIGRVTFVVGGRPISYAMGDSRSDPDEFGTHELELKDVSLHWDSAEIPKHVVVEAVSDRSFTRTIPLSRPSTTSLPVDAD